MAEDDVNLPTIGVVVPTRDRPAPLSRCLVSLERVDYPRDRFEVIVVDDGGSGEVAAGLDRSPRELPVRVLETPGRGPASARNAGAAASDTALLAFTDDDCAVDGGWLRALARAHGENGEALVGGRVENGNPRNLFSAASHDLIEFLYAEYHRGAPEFFCSNNMAVSRRQFLERGGFDETFPQAAGEDRDLCDRWKRAGGVLRYEPAARVAHHLTIGARAFWAQHARYGRAAARFWELHRGRTGESLRPEPPRFYWRMITHPLRREPLPGAISRAALLVVAQAANALGFYLEKRRMWLTTR